MSLEIKNLQCQLEGHNNSQVIDLCLQENCNASNKFTCVECIFNEHSQHKIIKANEVGDILSKNFDSLRKIKKEKDEIMNEYIKSENNIKKEIDILKENTIKFISEKINSFFENLKIKCADLILRKEKMEEFLKMEDFINSNAAPTSKLETENLSKLCYDLYKKGSNKNIINDWKVLGNKMSFNELKNYLNSKKYEDNLKNYSENQFNDLKEYIRQNFFNEIDDFFLYILINLNGTQNSIIMITVFYIL